MDCPKCLGKLSKVEIKFHVLDGATPRKEGVVKTIEVDQCFVCHGVWFDSGELETYLKMKLTILDSPAIDLDLIEELDKKIAKCPRCNVNMVKKVSPINKDVTIDFCEKCRGTWLDSTEIDRIEAKNLSFNEKVSLLIKSFLPSRAK